MSKTPELGTFEEMVLLAIAKLGERAYGATIADEVEKATGKDPAPGVISATLGRLEAKGFISTWMSEPIAVRGGRSKRCCRVEGAGEEALREVEEARCRLRVPARVGPTGRLHGTGGVA